MKKSGASRVLSVNTIVNKRLLKNGKRLKEKLKLLENHKYIVKIKLDSAVALFYVKKLEELEEEGIV